MAHPDEPHQAVEALEPDGADPSQLDLFGAPAPLSRDPAGVRAELAGILEKARAAPEVPWPARDVPYDHTAFTEMAGWLPEEEASQLRFEFAAELARLEAV